MRKYIAWVSSIVAVIVLVIVPLCLAALPDSMTGASVTVDYEHHEIHSGSHYVVTDYDTDVDILGPKYWHIITPNTTKHIHLIGNFYADGAGIWELYENPTTTGNGTGLAEINSNRNSANTATAQVFYDATNSAAGTLLWKVYLGELVNSANNSGGAGSRSREFVLKQNEQYLIKFTPAADDTLAGVELIWYEHTTP